MPTITIDMPGISNQNLVHQLNNLEYRLMEPWFKSISTYNID